ncbi:MAG: hypothetical protein OHK0039_46050 [Bacteroidia bacterium]
MTHDTATELICAGVLPHTRTWADLGAGTGTFTLALLDLLPQGCVYALDKSPHMLWRLSRTATVDLVVVEGDFTQPMDLPQVDGILLANALHYVPDPLPVLGHILTYLAPGGSLLFIEYDTDRPNLPWVPHPISQQRWEALAAALKLPPVQRLGQMSSQYGPHAMYASACHGIGG